MVFTQITTWDPRGWLLPQETGTKGGLHHTSGSHWLVLQVLLAAAGSPAVPEAPQPKGLQAAQLCCRPMANLLHHLHWAARAFSSADSASRTFQCLRLQDAMLEGAGMHQELILLTPQDYILHGFEQMFIHDRAKCDAT